MDSNDVLVAVDAAPERAVSPVEPRRRTLLARFLSALGPGLITGAADDDPSGIATYSAAGALLGTTQLWIALVTWPLMAAVQMTCARVAMATGKGLAAALKWLTLSLSAYIVTAFIVRPDWSAVVHATFVPSLPTTREGWAMLVGVLGTTIGPYLFFLQASQEVEEA